MSMARTGSLLHDFAGSFAAVRRRHGMAAALCSVADRLAAKTLSLCVSHVFCCDLQHIVAGTGKTLGLTCRFLTPDEIRSFSADPCNELGPEMATRAAAGHDVCFGVLAGDRLAGYGWCALGSIEAEHTGGLALSFPAHIGYLYKGFTHPDFRGRGLNGCRMALAGPALAQRGIRQVVCLVDWTNWASIQSCRRFGCKSLGLAVTFRIAGRPYWFMPDAARQLGVRVADDAEARAARRLETAVGAAA